MVTWGDESGLARRAGTKVPDTKRGLPRDPGQLPWESSAKMVAVSLGCTSYEWEVSENPDNRGKYQDGTIIHRTSPPQYA